AEDARPHLALVAGAAAVQPAEDDVLAQLVEGGSQERQAPEQAAEGSLVHTSTRSVGSVRTHPRGASSGVGSASHPWSCRTWTYSVGIASRGRRHKIDWTGRVATRSRRDGPPATMAAPGGHHHGTTGQGVGPLAGAVSRGGGAARPAGRGAAAAARRRRR